MRKMILVFVLAILANGCAMLQTMPDGRNMLVPATQVGANVQVLDLCGYKEHSRLFGTDGYAQGGLEVLPGREFWVAMSTRNGTQARSVALTYVAMSDGQVIGSVSQSFPVNLYEGTRKFQWVITRDRSSFGGGQGIYVSRCPSTAR